MKYAIILVISLFSFACAAQEVSPEDFGAIGNGNANDVGAIQDAIDYCESFGGTVRLTAGKTYKIKNGGLKVDAPCRIVGRATLFRTDSDSPVLTVNGQDISVENVRLFSTVTSQRGNIEVHYLAHNVSFVDLSVTDGYAGIWVRGGSGVRISGGLYTNCSHNIYIGGNTAAPVSGIESDIYDVTISNLSATYAKPGGDGIKTGRRVRNLKVSGCSLDYNSQDGIDLFTSGEDVSVVNNSFRGNQVVAVDIKSYEVQYPSAVWGKGGKITIADNVIDGRDQSGNFYPDSGGIKIAKTTDGDMIWGVSVSGNVVQNIGAWAIYSMGNGVSISNNILVDNALNVAVGYNVLMVKGNENDPVVGVSISGNVIYGGGSAAVAGNSGIWVEDAEDVTISNNIVDNTPPSSYGVPSLVPQLNYGYTISDCSGIALIGNKAGQSLLTAPMFLIDRRQISGYGNSDPSMNRPMVNYYSSAELPASTSIGEIAWDTTMLQLRTYTGSRWSDYETVQRLSVASGTSVTLDYADSIISQIVTISIVGPAMTAGVTLVGKSTSDPHILAQTTDYGQIIAGYSNIPGYLSFFHFDGKWHIRNNMGELLNVVVKVVKFS